MSATQFHAKVFFSEGQGQYPAICGTIFEANRPVASFRRAATVDGYVPGIDCTFYNEEARQRFVAVADSLSVSELVEALIA